MKLSYLQFVLDQWSTVPPVENADLTGKTVVVIGANSGIGLEAAKHFASMNPSKLILACRSEVKGNAALSEIASETGSKSCELWQVDLAEFASVARFAEKFRQECDRLDILVMNAGIVPVDYEQTRDGWEQGGVILHLRDGHLITEDTDFNMIHYWADISEEIKTSRDPITLLNSPKYRTVSAMANRYSDTKVLSLFFVRSLQDRLKSVTSLTVNAPCPGFCHSNIRQGYRGRPENVVIAIMEALWAWTPEQGSRQVVYCAVGERDNEDHLKGAHTRKATVVEPSDFVISEEGRKMQANVWEETIEVLTKEAPQLKSIVREYLV